MLISDLQLTTSNITPTSTGISIGETVLMHRQSGSSLDVAVTTGDLEYSVEAASGDNVFLPRHVDHTLSKTTYAGLYERVKGTPYCKELNPSSETIGITSDLSVLIPLPTSVDWLSYTEGGNMEVVVIKGVFIDKNKTVYIAVLSRNVMTSAGRFCVYKTDAIDIPSSWDIVGDPIETSATEIAPSSAALLNVHGREYIGIVLGHDYASRHYMYDLTNGTILVNKGFRYEYPKVETKVGGVESYSWVNADIYGTGYKAVIEFQHLLVAVSTTDVISRTRLINSTDGIRWKYDGDTWYDTPVASHDGFVSSAKAGTTFMAFFHDKERQELCTIALSGAELAVYYTADGYNWTKGLVLRDDWTTQTWTNDTTAPGVELGTDVVQTTNVCGEVIKVDGKWYLGWANQKRQPSTVPVISFTRFEGYRAGDTATLEHIEAIPNRRNCMTFYDGGPPSYEYRTQCAYGIIASTEDWVALSIPRTINVGSLGHYGDGLSWSAFQAYTTSDDGSIGINIPPMVIARDELPLWFDTVQDMLSGTATNGDYSGISTVEVRSLSLAKVLNGPAETDPNSVSLQNAIWALRKSYGVNGGYYAVGDVESPELTAYIACTFSTDPEHGIDPTNFVLPALEGYDTDWNPVFPLTRVL